MLVKAGPMIGSIYGSWLEQTHQPHLGLRNLNLLFNKILEDEHAHQNLSHSLKLFWQLFWNIYLNFFFFEKMRFKLSVKMAFNFYKIF